ncbi:C39 family peptidase [Bacillus vallismortis]|uniref:C39 family peptidase n=1 Tax=Bacillus vallismortis TaxID=72361 RepID=UPI002282091F|nr:C39 family peptidase [Bacillus vallismortis]MCY8307515.1 C39 family peptidase [Bacillus vallismortis]MCY8595391.1 C39 family peptidase [Bacillus vallismortis]
MKTLRTLCVLIILSGVIFFGLKIYAKDIDIPFFNSIKREAEEGSGTAANSANELQGSAEPLNVVLYNQMDAPRLYNGCEVTSLAMVLNYAGYDVTKNTLANQIATVPLTYSSGLKGDPNDGFVGDMANGPGLGVYHGPIYQLAKTYAGDKVSDLTGKNISAVYQQLEKGNPVWVITTASLAPVDNMQTWKTPNGTIDITFSVHSVAVTGYDEKYVYLNDPYGYKNRKTDRTSFENAWEQMGSQAIVIQK